MIKFLLSGCLLFGWFSSAKAASDSIWWGNQRLEWSHFKGKADTATYNRNHFASTFWRLTYYHRWNARNRQVEVIAYAWFDGRRSWVRSSQRTNMALLQHEQGHFDLAEILVRRFKEQVANTHFSNANYTDSLQRIFNRLLTDINKSQLQYDEDTVFGEKPPEQRRWQAFILATLTRLGGYTDRQILSKEP